VLLAAVRTGTVSDLIAHAAQGMDAITAIRLTATTMRESTLIDQDACLLVSTEFAIALAYPGAPDGPPAGAPRETLAASISAATERPAGATAPLSGREAAAAPAVTAPVQSSEAASPPARSRRGSRIRPAIALRRQRPSGARAASPARSRWAKARMRS
jgi:hypothetical protein